MTAKDTKAAKHLTDALHAEADRRGKLGHIIPAQDLRLYANKVHTAYVYLCGSREVPG